MFGHKAENFRSKYDCSKWCCNCGARDHQASSGKAKVCCLLCKRKKEQNCDHSTMSGKCPYFKGAIQGLRGEKEVLQVLNKVRDERHQDQMESQIKLL